MKISLTKKTIEPLLNKLTGIFAILAALFTLQACTPSNGKIEIQEFIKIIQTDNPEEFESVMYDFIESAKRKNVDKMISLTSKKTIDLLGIGSLRSKYDNDIGPALRACEEISDGGEAVHLSGTNNNESGWIFRKLCKYDKDKIIKIQFVVIREHEKKVIASVSAIK